MKKSVLFIVLLFSFSAVVSQKPFKTPEQYKFYLPYKDYGENILPDILRERPERLKDSLINNIPSATFSHTTPYGKVYTLPVDNMPCLVPNKKQVIPMPGNYGPFPKSNMPNPALPHKYKIIPRKKRRNN